MTSSLLVQVGLLARRSIVRTLRQPAVIVPSIIFPLLQLAMISGGLDAASRLPGFPAESYLAFALAIPFMQGSLFGSSAAGTDLARDIETGFMNRLALTPMRAGAMLLGQLAGVVVLAAAQATVFLAVGLIVGVEIRAGFGGMLLLVLFMMLVALAFGSIGAFFALRTGSAEAVQGLFPLLFVALFLSSMNLPRELIETGWFRTIASWNPVSYLIEGMRSLIITGWDGRALALGFGTAAAVVLVGIAASSAALRTRMART